MNNLEIVASKLPKRVKITQKILDTANVNDVCNCIGALTLKRAFGTENIHITWGRCQGMISEVNIFDNILYITTKEILDMMEVTKPQFVTFIKG